ncbi:MAG: hypothetical protein PHI99_06045 [Syntrophales bacterium]|nr:hypothetical protein [Syntrophales bacterium]
MSDILNMEAGRELDRLVAEKVMGWQAGTRFLYFRVATIQGQLFMEAV